MYNAWQKFDNLIKNVIDSCLLFECLQNQSDVVHGVVTLCPFNYKKFESPIFV